jgi:hypothetical protein
MDSRELAKLVGKGIFYASIQSSIGSVEMSSKFSVINFCKDQDTLDNAAAALKGYIIIATIWSVGTALSMYATHGYIGAMIGLVANAIMMTWIIVSYIKAFATAASKYNLKKPTILNKDDWMYILGGSSVFAVVTCMAGGYLKDMLR